MELIQQNTEWIKGKSFVLTGGFGDVEHDTINKVISTWGGTRDHGVLPDTDYCIWEERIYGSTEKLKKAREFNGHGCNITIMTKDEFIKKLAGEEITLSARQTSSNMSRIAEYMCETNPEAVEEYLETHELKKPASQTILRTLIKTLGKVSFTAQRKWCDKISETSGLDFKTYKFAAEYFARIAEYDTALKICDLILPGKAVDEESAWILDAVEDLRTDIEYYRVKPYWPNLRLMKLQLAEIYDSKGIAHPGIPMARKKTYCGGTAAEYYEEDEIVTRTGAHVKPSNILSDEHIQEITDEAQKIDYSSNEDYKYRDFVSTACFNIAGIGESTMEMLIDAGWINSFADIFRLKEKKEEMISSGLFQEKKVEKMLSAIEAARTVSDIKFLNSLHITGLSEMIARSILDEYSVTEFLEMIENHESIYDLMVINGIGTETSARIITWFESDTNKEVLHDLMKEITIKEESKNKGNSCEGLTFVVTGSVHVFKNRDALKNYIFAQGGKLSGSVNKSTDFLVNNDIESQSSKNKKAHQLNIPIISEDEFIERFGFGEA